MRYLHKSKINMCNCGLYVHMQSAELLNFSEKQKKVKRESATDQRTRRTLLAEMLQVSSNFSILDPVNPFGRRSQSNKWLSVPSVATS